MKAGGWLALRDEGLACQEGRSEDTSVANLSNGCRCGHGGGNAPELAAEERHQADQQGARQIKYVLRRVLFTQEIWMLPKNILLSSFHVITLFM
jgi:hypothetical protein